MKWSEALELAKTTRVRHKTWEDGRFLKFMHENYVFQITHLLMDDNWELYIDINEISSSEINRLSDNFIKSRYEIYECYNVFLESLKTVKTRKGFYNLKKDLLIDLITNLPLGARDCLDCIKNDFRNEGISACIKCLYAEEKGESCTNSDSKYNKVKKTQNDLKIMIANLFTIKGDVK